MKDALGQRGEAIFTVLMTEFHSHAGPIFRKLMIFGVDTILIN